MRAFSAGRCDAFTTDKSQLASTRTTLEKPDNYVILPEDFSKEPLGPMVRQGDEQWFNVALVAQRHAGGRGIRNHVQERRRNGQEFQPQHPAHSRRDAGHGQEPGRGRQVAFNIIKQVGNYGESFEATLGKSSAMKLERGLNASYKQGGLMYGWPVR